MVRPEKKSITEEIRAQIENSGFVVLVDYRGLTVGQMTELRLRLDTQVRNLLRPWSVRAEWLVRRRDPRRHATRLKLEIADGRSGASLKARSGLPERVGQRRERNE